MNPDEIIAALKELKVPHAEIALAIGRDRTAATKLLNGQRQMKADETVALQRLVRAQARLRLALDPDPKRQVPWSVDGFIAEMLPIRGEIQAGAWLELDPQDQPEIERHPAAPDPRYPRSSQWLSRVRGDSMNALVRKGQPAGILDGDLVHVVDAIAIDYQFHTGDIVEVERSRFSGRERELTLKQVEVKPDGSICLWPRSSNPRWSQPVEYGLGDADDVEVRVRGKVIQHIRTF